MGNQANVGAQRRSDPLEGPSSRARSAPLDPTDVSLVHVALLSQLGLGQTVLLAQGHDLHRNPIRTGHHLTLCLGIGTKSTPTLPSGLLIRSGHPPNLLTYQYGVFPIRGQHRSEALSTSPLALLELHQQPSRLSNLSLLTPLLRIPALVIAPDQEHDPVTVEVRKDAQQDPLYRNLHTRRVTPEHASDLVSIVTDPELVQSTPERLEPLGPHQVDTSHREDETDSGIEGYELRVRQAVDEPLEWNRPVIGFKRLGVQPDSIKGPYRR